jgi:hypothetical protein
VGDEEAVDDVSQVCEMALTYDFAGCVFVAA